MKKPFFKKTSGYLDRIQAEYDALKSQFDEAKKALAIAATDYEAKARASRELEAKSPANTYLSDHECRLRRLRDDAESIHRQVGYKLMLRSPQTLKFGISLPGCLDKELSPQSKMVSLVF